MVPTEELEDYPRRSRLHRALAALGALALIAAVGYIALRPGGTGGSVPEFELDLLSGDGTLSSDELKGTPVVINFFASWCTPCREEAPLLESTWKEYRDEGVQFVGINIQDTPANARLFVEMFDITYPVVRDPDQTVARDFDVFGLPQTFFVTSDWEFSSVRKGEQVDTRGPLPSLGAITEEELTEQIEELLARRN